MKGLLLAYIVLLFWAFPGTKVQDSKVSTIKLEQLEHRLAQGGDTTFVVNFWATWCAPCVAELPYFEQFNDVYGQVPDGTNPVKVLLVSLDAPKLLSRVNDFIEARKLRNEVLLLDESNQQYYIDQISTEWSGAIPATLFVNTKKGIRLFKEQEFDFETLEANYLSIINK